MFRKLDLMYLNAKSRIENGARKMLAKHEGLSGIIVAIGLVVIALIVVVYFKTKTQPALQSSVDITAGKMNSFTSELTGGTPGGTPGGTH